MMIIKILRRLYNLSVCIQALGLISSIKFMFISPFYTGLMKIKLPNGRSFYFRGNFDRGILSHFFKPNYYISSDSDQPIKTIIDGGAFIGDETVRFLSFYPSAQVIAIEAAEENFEILLKNCQRDNRAQPLYGALYPEKANIKVVQRSSLESFQVQVTDDDSQAIPTWDIPSIMEKFNLTEIDILKLDIEGAEYELFSIKSEPWIQKVKAIIFEVDRNRPEMTQQIFRTLNQINFNSYISGENLILIRKDLSWKVHDITGFSKLHAV